MNDWDGSTHGPRQNAIYCTYRLGRGTNETRTGDESAHIARLALSNPLKEEASSLAEWRPKEASGSRIGIVACDGHIERGDKGEREWVTVVVMDDICSRCR